jgi:hypothetical protein
MTKREKYPIIFRKAGNRKDGFEILAVFPYGSANIGNLVCYAHLGQHSECALQYYNESKPAKPQEYAGLLIELRGIYETGDDAVELAIKQRLPHDWRDHAWSRT